MPDGIEGKLAAMEGLLEQTAAMAKENNELLRSIRRMNRIAFWSKIVIWIVVLGLPLLFIGPLLHMILPLSSDKAATNLFGIPSVTEIQHALQQYQTQGVQNR